MGKGDGEEGRERLGENLPNFELQELESLHAITDLSYPG